MIQISGSAFEPTAFLSEYPLQPVEKKILDILSSSSHVYSYSSLEALRFELQLRRNIIDASVQLNQTAFSFRTFRKSKCNPAFWKRTDEGGFLLKEGVKPSDAITDIYVNSTQYGTECATAMVIVYYKAVLQVFPQHLFNQLFSTIYLMDWQHLDSSLGITYFRDVPNHLPGDCRYFKNPDVDPRTPEWQGENAIDLGNGYYYGHGIGIRRADEIIYALNTHRVEGSNVSAYLMDSATRPNFKSLFHQYNSTVPSL